MIRVVHFDYQRMYSELIRELLKKDFKDNPDVEYHDVTNSDEHAFKKNMADLEALLPEKDVLLIHPGIKSQKRVMGYPARFPHLKVVLLVPGSKDDYDVSANNVVLFGYKNRKEVIDYILSVGNKDTGSK